MRSIDERAALVVATFAATCALTLGCGGPADEAQEARAAFPKGSAEAVAVKLLRTVGTATTTEDCAPVRPIVRRSPQKFLCPPLAITGRIRDFEIVSSATYGTAAVIDYTTRKARDGATMLMFRAPDGGWGVSRFGLINEPAAETDDGESRPGFDKAVAAFVRSVRERDCERYVDHVITGSAEQSTVCRGEFAATRSLAKGIEASGDPKPRYLGGNETFGFYALELPRPTPRYLTIEVVRTVEGALQPYMVLGVHPGPVSHD